MRVRTKTMGNTPDQTISNRLQSMEDKGWLKFLGNGYYETLDIIIELTLKTVNYMERKSCGMVNIITNVIIGMILNMV
jgi:hypothetical protein